MFKGEQSNLGRKTVFVYDFLNNETFQLTNYVP